MMNFCLRKYIWDNEIRPYPRPVSIPMRENIKKEKKFTSLMFQIKMKLFTNLNNLYTRHYHACIYISFKYL